MMDGKENTSEVVDLAETSDDGTWSTARKWYTYYNQPIAEC